MTTRIGLIVNPIAGMGGAVALKGTDGTAAAAAARGAAPLAGARATTFLRRLMQLADAAGAGDSAWAASGTRRPQLLVGAEAMGMSSAEAAGIAAAAVAGGPAAGAPSAAVDSRRAAAAMISAGCQLIVFAGGDGTARDIASVVGERLPLLGIPAGVKMHSGVFATTPTAAAHVVARFVDNPRTVEMREVEVMDIDEALLRQGRLSPRLFAIARVPFERRAMAGPKTVGASEEAALAAAADDIVRELAPEVVALIGPGTSARAVKRRLGSEGTLLGVDAFAGGRLVAADLTEQQCLALVRGRPGRIVVGVTGGQGFLFGRGNQQLSPPVIRAVGRDGITVIAGVNKLQELVDGVLRVDTGDAELDRELSGYIKVVTAAGTRAIMKVAEPI